MTFAQDIDYWIHKTKAFLHDPPDKAIHIPGHEERANALLAAAGLVGSTLAEEEYRQADIIASGMDRATLPGYHATDERKRGQVDFCQTPAITHPTGTNPALDITLPPLFRDGKQAVEAIAAEMQALIKKNLGDKAGSGQGLSEHALYRKNEAAFAPARFHYLFFLLRQRLMADNVGGLGGLWNRLPADTRLPDHSIWQHNGLVSALASCHRLSLENKASLMVFALTPVQDFVGRARKLRDYWTGSIILSWLALEGIKAVIYELGADHIIYPSLHGQSLVDGLLGEWGMGELLSDTKNNSGVASFPNKFVCLVPTGMEAGIAAKIEGAITSAWISLGQETLALLEKKIGRVDKYLRWQFDRQLGGYWECHWSAAPLVKGGQRTEIEDLLHQESIAGVFDFFKQSNDLLVKKGILKHQSSGEGQLYSITHRLTQAMLAAGKSHRRDRREREEGIKCDLFGEFEVLHYEEDCGKNPKPSEDKFWRDVRDKFGESEFGKNERLCAIAMLKRLAYLVCKQIDGHPLRKMFKDAEIFPSTTEMALHDWWQQLNHRAKSQEDPKAVRIAEELAVFNWKQDSDKEARRKMAQWLHGLNEPEQTRRNGCEITKIDLRDDKEKSAARKTFKLHPVKDIHKYYAVLLMDGDKMGRLINGETLGATWKSAIHPALHDRLIGDFDPEYKKFWEQRLDNARLVSPAVHAAISEALGDFSILTVPAIIERYHGHLIYAGGDDVCAILPASTVLDAAREIAGAYGQGFVFTNSTERAAKGISGSWSPEPGKLGVHLGSGNEISISAGIMIAHHKKPLGRVIVRAHELLNIAKKEGGRNAFALELDKRSGGGRIFMAKWREDVSGRSVLDHFLATAAALQSSEQAAMSSSLAYRLATFENGLLALLDKHPGQLVTFVAKQLDRSGLSKGIPKEEKEKRLNEVAGHIAALIGRRDKKGRLPLESLVVANFVGQCLKEHQGDKHDQ